MRLSRTLASALLLLAACATTEATQSAPETASADLPAADAFVTDGVAPLPETVPAAETTDAAEALDVHVAPDVAADAGPDVADTSPPPTPLLVHPPLGPPPADPLAGAAVESCAVIDVEECHAGKTRRCGLYDVGKKAFVEAPEPLALRAYHFDRWYDLYHQPSGQTAERTFTQAAPAGSPEAEWGTLDRFGGYGGLGDSAIWSGTALTATALRYRATGTAADYARMEEKTRRVLAMFDVTGIPGYLARHHFLRLDPGGPKSDRIAIEYGTKFDHNFHVVKPTAIAGLPEEYSDGVPDAQGALVTGTPMWQGNPSIDQYSGPLTAFPLVYGLLKDEALKARIATQVTCYLKRLVRVEIRNLQKNPQALDAVKGFFAGNQMSLDPGDYDLTKLDTVVGYGLLQPNSLNAATFDASCPATIQMTPATVIDAGSDDFLAQILTLASRLQTGKSETLDGIDHLYAINVRGGDAVHLLHLAAFAWWMTNDSMYKTFLQDELVGALHVDHVASIAGAFQLPRWCRSYYGDHITYSPWWSLLTLLDESPLLTTLRTAFEVELWQKSMRELRNTKFNLMYLGEIPKALATGAVQALGEVLEGLDEFGGNGGKLDDPRRSYDLPRATVIAMLPTNNGVACPTEAERKQCEDGVSLFGITIPGEKITRACTGEASECHLGALCATPMAKLGVPASLRTFEDFVWQRNPFKLGDPHAVAAMEQSPGVDVIEEFWMARVYGIVQAGAGQVLAWKVGGGCE